MTRTISHHNDDSGYPTVIITDDHIYVFGYVRIIDHEEEADAFVSERGGLDLDLS